MKNFIKALSVMALTVVVFACNKSGEFPYDATYSIVSVGDFKTIEGSVPDITFAQDGRFYGTTGCNRYFGEYTVEDGNIKIADNMGMTRMMCPEADEQERILSEALPKIVKYCAKGTQLTLTTSDNVEIVCEKAPQVEVEATTETSAISAPVSTVDTSVTAVEAAASTPAN
ncbi:MAG: META domain-containing protein [Flavobacteriales bacterium]|nr:META domain-containing protein [Flavobacteriales bacterium]